MTVVEIANQTYIGLSTDVKPTTANAGARFIETDTNMLWQYNGTSWTTGKYTIAAPNIMRTSLIDAQLGNYVVTGFLGQSTSAKIATGAYAKTDASSTEGPGTNASTTTSNATAAGFLDGNSNITTTANILIRFRFRENQTATHSRFWVGLCSSATSPIVDDPLGSGAAGGPLRGIYFGHKVGDTNYTVIQNNLSNSSYDNLVSTTSFPVNAVDTNWHSVELATADNGAHFTYSLDNVTPFTLSTTQLLSATVRMAVAGVMTNDSSSTACTFDLQYLWASCSANNK